MPLPCFGTEGSNGLAQLLVNDKFVFFRYADIYHVFKYGKGHKFVPMKSLVILVVALTMLFKPLWPIADYIVNYDYIVNVLCENKEQPELQCDGKCYLSKMLAEESNQNDKNPFEQRQTTVEQVHPICFQSLLVFDFSMFVNSTAKQPITYSKTFFSSIHVLAMIQPPEMS